MPANLIEPIQLAFEEAHAARRIPRRIELVVEEAHGLPLHAAKNAIDGYRRLVDAGCVGVIGPLISDNAIALAPVVDALQVPAISWCGTERFHGAYCFDLGNGGCGDTIGVSYHGFANTHVDALCHIFTEDGRLYGGRPASDVTPEGARSNAIDRWRDGIVTRGVLYDVVRRFCG